MLYERLSLPWKLIPHPAVFSQQSICRAAEGIYDETKDLWNIRKGNIQNCTEVPIEDRIEIYAEDNLEPHRGRRTPWMKLDYDSWDTWVEETADTFFQQPREKRPRVIYRENYTWKELAILNVECSVDGIPWVLDDEE